MSLINQMLKDLAKQSRGAIKPDVVLSGLPLSYVDEIDKQDKIKKVGLILGLLLMMGLLTIMLYLEMKKSRMHSGAFFPATMIGSTGSVINNDTVLYKPNPIPPVSLIATGVQLQQHDTLLHFTLSNTTLY